MTDGSGPLRTTGTPSGPQPACTACHRPLRAVHDNWGTNLHCDGCGGCWQEVLGWVRAVDPATCSRCQPTEARVPGCTGLVGTSDAA